VSFKNTMHPQRPIRPCLPGLFCCGLFCLLARFAAADTADDWERMKTITPRGYVCGFTEKPLVIDGRLDEPAWQAAPWTEDFVDIEGIRRPTPRFRTRAKMLWDNDYLYIGAELEEPARDGHGHQARCGHLPG